MRRSLKDLAEREFDLLVVGGGVYGAAIAWDATLRGLSVALVEKDDFGGATSFNSAKTIHGGLRYLQHADLRRMRESVRERSTLMRIAPHLVHPLAFLLPTYHDLRRSRAALGLALLLNDLVSFDRNRNGERSKFIPGGRLISREDCLARAPGIASEGLTGGAVWYDCHMHNSDRMTLGFVRSAAEAGAEVANHLEVTGFLRQGARVTGVRAKDGLGGEDIDIRARLVVNAAGPWVDRVLALLDDRPRAPLFIPSKAMNLVTRPLLEATALGLASPRAHHHRDAFISKGWRFITIVPWRGTSLIGTQHSAYQGGPGGVEASERDIEEFIAEINQAYPAAKLRREDVRLVHRGLLPAASPGSRGEEITLLKQYRIHDHGRQEGIPGLLSLVGVKYTTARDVAEKTVDRVFEIWGRRAPPSRGRESPLYGGNIHDFEEFVMLIGAEASKRSYGLAPEVVRHLALSYGSAQGEVLRAVEESPSWAEPVSEGTPVVKAEIRYAVREEMAKTLGSVILRRTELGSAGHPGRACLATCAAIMGTELGWSEARRQQEIDEVEAFYRTRS